MQEHAKRMTKKFGKVAFKVFNGRLESFKLWNNIVWNNVCEKSIDVDINTVIFF